MASVQTESPAGHPDAAAGGELEEYADDFDAAFAGEKLFFEEPGVAGNSPSASKIRAASASHISSLIDAPEEYVHSSTFKKLPKG